MRIEAIIYLLIGLLFGSWAGYGTARQNGSFMECLWAVFVHIGGWPLILLIFGFIAWYDELKVR